MMNGQQTAVHVRVDDRLIHGQVVTVWVRSLGIKTIWVVSDRAAAEPIEVILLKSSVPSHLTLDVLTVTDAIARWQDGHVDSLLVLTETIAAAVGLVAAGLPIAEVDIGGVRYQPQRIALSKAVYVGEAEVQSLMALAALHVPAHLRILPSDAKVDAYERIRQRWPNVP